jgi:hypothetical protein
VTMGAPSADSARCFSNRADSEIGAPFCAFQAINR